MIAAFKVSKESKLASLLIITTVQAVSIWNIGIKQRYAQNIVATNFINQNLGHDVSWENGSYMHTMVYPYVNRFILYHDESDAT